MNNPLFNTCFKCGNCNMMMHSERLCCNCWWKEQKEKEQKEIEKKLKGAMGDVLPTSAGKDTSLISTNPHHYSKKKEIEK